MSAIAIIIIAIVVLSIGYIFYGRFLAKKWGIDPNAKTPAYELQDDLDYVPSDRGVVFGHQFASIAGAGPINGPIQAAIFGWVPILLWILFGGIFFGAVQDFASMYASVKNKGRTIGYIIELYIGKAGKKLFLVFTWLFSILIIAAFADIICKTFDGIDGTVAQNMAGAQVSVITMSFIVFAFVLGLLLRFCKLRGWPLRIVSVILLVASVVIGMRFPIFLSDQAWQIIIFVYVALACILPVWVLLQPRDYLNSYLLIAMIVASVVGIFVANPTMKLDAFSGFMPNGQLMFPYLFVTVACGAISGVHALVSSGTSSKQVKNEKDILPVSYGAMLVESLLAVIALIAVGAGFSSSELAGAGTPSTVFATSIASFLSVLHIPTDLSFSLITLSVSAFALTTLDSIARIGRLSWQELFLDSSIKDEDIHGVRKVVTSVYFSTGLMMVLAYFLVRIGYENIWPLFGASNQLLAALALIACAVYFKRTKKQGAFLWIPMIFMLATTLFSLVLTIVKNIKIIANGTVINIFGAIIQAGFAIAIFILGIIVAKQGFEKLRKKEEDSE